MRHVASTPAERPRRSRSAGPPAAVQEPGPPLQCHWCTLRFNDSHEESAFTDFLSSWYTRCFDPIAALVSIVMWALGLVYMVKKSMTDCYIYMLAQLPIHLAFCAYALAPLPPAAHLRTPVLLTLRTLESAPLLLLKRGCRTFYELNTRRFVQRLFHDSGILYLAAWPLVKPLPFAMLLPLQLSLWAAAVARLGLPLCARFAQSAFYGPLLQSAYQLLTPPPAAAAAPLAAPPPPPCACTVVVQTLLAALGVVLPLSWAYVRELRTRQRWLRDRGIPTLDHNLPGSAHLFAVLALCYAGWGLVVAHQRATCAG